MIPSNSYYLDADCLIESNAPDDVTDWNPTSEYLQGALVRAEDNIIYECAVGPATFLAGQYCAQPYGENLKNINQNPVDYTTVPAMDRTAYPDYVDIDDCYKESGKLWWIRRGEEKEYLNKYRMFTDQLDMVTRSPTSADRPILHVKLRAKQDFAIFAFVRTLATKIIFRGWVVPNGYIDPSSGSDSSGSDNGSSSSFFDSYISDWIENKYPVLSEILSGDESEEGSSSYVPGMIYVTKTLDLVLPTNLRLPGAEIYKNSILYLDGFCPGGTEFTVTFIYDMSISSIANYAQCGYIGLGYPIKIGTALYNTTVGMQDFSRKERDAFGNIDLVARNFTNKVVYKIAIDTEAIYAVKEFLSYIRASLSIYIAAPNLFGTIVAGYFKDFTIPYESYTESIFDLEVEGL